MAEFRYFQPIAARFFLRRWVDRALVDIYEWFDRKPRNSLMERLAIWTAIFAVYASPFIFGTSCLIGFFYPGPLPAIGLLVSIVLWPLRWAARPWVERPDALTVRTLRPNQYVLISSFAKSEWIDDMVEWTRVSPDFDTRHLNACTALWQEEPLNVRKLTSGVSMKNALDLFDGEVGRRIKAADDARALDQNTASVNTHHAKPRL